MVRRIIKGKRREFFNRMAQLLCRHSERSRGIFFVAVKRIVAQTSKRRFGIICQLGSPLEKGRAKGAGWMCLEEAPFYAAVSMTTAQSVTPYRHLSEARNLCHSRSHGQCLEIPNGKPAIHLPSGIAPYIWQRSCHHKFESRDE